ncbi:MAG TPA: sialidase family protein, partial [Pirellulales bacterium]
MPEPSNSVASLRSALLVALALAGFHSAAVNTTSAADPNPLTETDVFLSGSDGYHTFRIPSLIIAKDGTLLAFAEGRKNGRSDSGDIDLVLRRSKNNGRTWTPLEIVVDDRGNTVGNPCPVVDRSTGVICLLVTRNLGADDQKQIMAGSSTGSRTVLALNSSDNGVTWSKPVDITPTVKEPGWGWYATGPGVGIQLSSGRLLVPCDHSVLPS